MPSGDHDKWIYVAHITFRNGRSKSAWGNSKLPGSVVTEALLAPNRAPRIELQEMAQPLPPPAAWEKEGAGFAYREEGERDESCEKAR